MASQLIPHSGVLLQASASTSTPALGVVVLGLGVIVVIVIALGLLMIALKALAGLMMEGLKIALIMFAVPVILVLLVREGHAQHGSSHRAEGLAAFSANSDFATLQR